MKSHILVTTKHLDICLEKGLFGASASQINYLGNVERDDIIFLLETSSGKLTGPFKIDSSLFYNNKPIWKNPDPFVYKVRFRSNGDVWESDITSLWSILLNRKKTNFYTFTTFQRSNNTLFPKEGNLLTDEIKKNGVLISPNLSSNLEKQPIDLLKNDRRKFSSESRLETFLLLKQREFINILSNENLIKKNLNPYVINQITIPGYNYNVDIALFFKNDVIIIELKKDAVDYSTIKQVKRYSYYWKLAGNNVKMVTLGSDINGEDEEITSLKYTINRENNKLEIENNSGKKYNISL